MQGARCGPGALSAAAGSFAGPLLGGLSFQYNLIAHVVVGGLASVAGGGSFANGAVTAAFGYLFNQAAKAARNSATAPGSSDRPELRALADDPIVSAAIDRAWAQSLETRREYGFWIIRDSTGSISISEWETERGQTFIVVPPTPDGAIAMFHTHPNPVSEGYYPGPTGYLKNGIPGDIPTAYRRLLPGIIQSEIGMYFYGPKLR
jgi:hypothetical protein